MTDTAQLYEKLYTIRTFENLLLDEFASGVFPGTTHTSLDTKPTQWGFSLMYRKMTWWSAITAATATSSRMAATQPHSSQN